jgi:hypothetical protein
MIKKPAKKSQEPALPTQFSHDGMIWRIVYIPEKAQENLGETHLNLNEIRLWVKGIPEDCLRETLQHEILHVVLRDCMAILHDSNSSPHDIEEAVVRMTSPRLFAIMVTNPELREFLYGK